MTGACRRQGWGERVGLGGAARVGGCCSGLIRQGSLEGEGDAGGRGMQGGGAVGAGRGRAVPVRG